MEELAYLKSHSTCKVITKKNAEHIYLATYFLPAKKREGIRALYALYNFINEGTDQASTVLEKQAALKKCNELIDRVFESRRRDFVYPFELVLEQTIVRYGIPKKLTQDMLAGMVLKSHFRQPRNEHELLSYTDHSMGSLFHMMMFVLGSTIEVDRHATAFGSSQEILDIVSRTRHYAQNGKVYYPEEWLQEEGLTSQDVLLLAQKKKASPGKQWLNRLWNVHNRLIGLGQRLNEEASGMIPYLIADGSRMCVALLCAHNNYQFEKLLKVGPPTLYQKIDLGLWDRVRIFSLSRQY